jgi:hypothetical protein
MNEEQAVAIADALSAEAWNSGGGIWLVRKQRTDGRLVVISGDVVCEYDSEDSFGNNEPAASILLC